MTEFQLFLLFISTGQGIFAALLALLYQYWPNRWVRAVALPFGLFGGLGLLGFFWSLLVPGDAVERLAQAIQRHQGLATVCAVGLCFALAYWREQQDQRQGITWGIYGQQSRSYLSPRTVAQRRTRPRQTKRHRQPRQNRQQGPSVAPQGKSPAAGSWRSRWRAGQLLRQLNAMTHDRDTSERLIRRILETNPGRDRPWAVERAIAELRRDRRA